MSHERLTRGELRETWGALSDEERCQAFTALDHVGKAELFLELGARDQTLLLEPMSPAERRSWIRILAPDDVVDLVQVRAPEERGALLDVLDPVTRREVAALLAYAEDEAGGLMNPRFARVRPDMTVEEAIAYLRRQPRQRAELIYYAYALDADQRLVGVLSFRDLFVASGNARVADVMVKEPVSVPEDLDQEAVSRVFAQHDLLAVPVVDPAGKMMGVVTVDDIVDVVQEEATEDIQRLGGNEVLGAPYLSVPFVAMLRKRAVWLAVLFVGEMLTATAMARYEAEIAKAVVLALFVPLIISSGGNSGSQASTLVIRAMALGEVRLRDWWRVARRELSQGLGLGAILGALGFVRIAAWQLLFGTYGEHAPYVALTVSASLVGIVLWGCMAGSLLPFALRRAGLDPASASAPFVATLVDVSGIVIYFSVASTVLRGRLL